MIGHTADVQIQASHRITSDVTVMAQSVARASVACLAEVRDQLLFAGEIKIEDEPELEDESGDDDTEMDFGDEDESREDEDVVEDGQPSVDDAPLFREGAFEIQVVTSDDGKLICDVPQSGWEGVVGVTGYGKEAEKQVSARMKVYFHIAEWLEKEHQDFLRKGPFGFAKALCTQKHLLDGPLEKVLVGDRKVTAPALSRYLRNVDLVWPTGAMPLKKCFGG